MIFGSMRSTIASLATAGYLVDFYSIPKIDLDAEWWSRGVQEDLTVVGKLYMGSGDITTRYMTAPYVLCFNEKLLGDYGVELPYQSVYDGTWTLEKLNLAIKDTAKDLDQNDKLNDSDFIGLNGPSDAFNAFLHGVNQHTLLLNAEGVPEVNTDEALYNAIDALGKYLMLPDIKIQDVSYGASKQFSDNRLLFIVNAACDISLLRDMQSDYGIVPIPKLEASQERYYCSANPFIATGVCVPYTVKDIDRIGTVMEAMAAVSRYTSAEAQYETTMLLKQARNEDSLKCLRIATEATTYDLSLIYTWAGDLMTVAREAFLNGTGYSLQIARYKTAFNRQIITGISKMTDN